MLRPIKPFKITLLNASFKRDFTIPEEFEKTLKKVFKKNSNIALYSAVQFLEFHKPIKEIMQKNGYKSTTSKPKRCSKEGQILGCDSYSDSLNTDLNNIDGFIYLGDGYFHPNALLLAQENEKTIKPVLILNLVQNTVSVIDKTHIEKYLKKRKANLAKFHLSENIGVFITSKWGQEYMQTALKLKDKFPDKNFYYFVADNFSETEMENFPFCDAFVNTACPRIGQDDVVNFKKSVVNIKDIL
jgi:diphthamide biosynthesis enzyme Dph1/Dph2-like protein